MTSGEPGRGRAGLGRNIEAVLFDYDRTLVHFERPLEALGEAQSAIVDCIAAAGHEPPALELLAVAVHDRVAAEVAAHAASGALEEIDVAACEKRAFADIGLALDEPTRDRCSALVQEAWWQGAHLYPDALPALRALGRAGLRLGLCSNAPYRQASMHGQLAHVGLSGIFDAVVFSAQVGWRKPAQQVFAAALQAIGMPAQRTVFVGDRIREDVRGAAAMGMRTVLVERDGAVFSETGTPPDAVISSLAELAVLVLDHPPPANRRGARN